MLEAPLPGEPNGEARATAAASRRVWVSDTSTRTPRASARAAALPDSWAPYVVPYLPSNAGQALIALQPDDLMLAPWTGFAWFCGYVAVAVAAAVVLLKRRDA